MTTKIQCLNVNLYHSLGIFSRRQTDDIFLIFPRKQDMTFQNKKNISKYRLLKILPRVLSILKCLFTIGIWVTFTTLLANSADDK